MSHDPVFEAQIHKRLLAGDVTAPAELAERYLEKLIRALCNMFRSGDRSLLSDAATDALMDYVKSPQVFDSRKASLFGYLKMAAKRDFLNALAKKGRKERGEILVEDVEHPIRAGNQLVECQSANPVETALVNRIAGQEAMRLAMREISGRRDRILLNLILAGERSTAAYAAVLGMSHLSRSEQKKLVKQHKDRLEKKLQRIGERLRARNR